VKGLADPRQAHISGRGPVVGTIAAAPFWVPWSIAAAATLVALLMTILYLRRG
jgi:hypothetical protein